MSIIDQLQSQLGSVNESIKNGGISSALQTELIANQVLLQGWINKILAGGPVTDQDIQQMQDTLDSSKKKTLEANANRTKRTIVFLSISILFLGAVIMFVHYKKNKK